MSSSHPWRQYRPRTRARTDRIVLDEAETDVPRLKTWTIRRVDSAVSDGFKRLAVERNCTIGEVLADALANLQSYEAEQSA